MTTFAVTYDYTPDGDAQRDIHRPAHVEFLRGLHADGTLYMSGPLATVPPRAQLVFEADDQDALEAILDNDPFYAEGLIATRTISQWNVFFDPRTQA